MNLLWAAGGSLAAFFILFNPGSYSFAQTSDVTAVAPSNPAPLKESFVVLADDGAWTWFNNPRALFHQGHLYFGYEKSAAGRPALSVFTPGESEARELFVFDMVEKDDHNNPGITPMASGGLLALASKHGTDRKIVSRASLTADLSTPEAWGEERVHTLPDAGKANTSYNNPFMLSSEGGAILDFIRYINWNPTLIVSKDNGTSWSVPVQVIQTGTGATRPYFQYCGNGKDRIDVIYTDGHPESSDNSVYHMFYQSDISGKPGGGSLRHSDGRLLKDASRLPLLHDKGQRGTVVYDYSSAPSSDPNKWISKGRAWVWDLVRDSSGNPVCVFQVGKTNVAGQGWQDGRLYYYYARWTGTAWEKRFIAQGGRPLYSEQLDYGGGMTIDPSNPNVVYISSNARDPFKLSSLTDVPLAEGDRYEIYRGVTKDGGLTFEWTPITAHSQQDNLRPYVPRENPFPWGLIWFQGSYKAYTKYSTRVMGLFAKEPVFSSGKN